MLKGCSKPLGIVLSGILCWQLSGFAAETDAKKPSAPAKEVKSEPKTETKTEAKAGTSKVETNSDTKAEAKESKQKEAAPAVKEQDPNKVLATVNGENIIQKDVNQIIHDNVL